MITEFSQLDLNKRYTYADYLSWVFNERVELFRGWVKRMSPAPNLNHQRISMNIAGTVWEFLTGKPYQVFTAPFDVRLLGPSKHKKSNRTCSHLHGSTA